VRSSWASTTIKRKVRMRVAPSSPSRAASLPPRPRAGSTCRITGARSGSSHSSPTARTDGACASGRARPVCRWWWPWGVRSHSRLRTRASTTPSPRARSARSTISTAHSPSSASAVAFMVSMRRG